MRPPGKEGGSSGCRRGALRSRRPFVRAQEHGASAAEAAAAAARGEAQREALADRPGTSQGGGAKRADAEDQAVGPCAAGH